MSLIGELSSTFDQDWAMGGPGSHLIKVPIALLCTFASYEFGYNYYISEHNGIVITLISLTLGFRHGKVLDTPAQLLDNKRHLRTCVRIALPA